MVWEGSQLGWGTLDLLLHRAWAEKVIWWEKEEPNAQTEVDESSFGSLLLFLAVLVSSRSHSAVGLKEPSMGSCALCPPHPQHCWTLHIPWLSWHSPSLQGHPHCHLNTPGQHRGKKGQHRAVLGTGLVSPHPLGRWGQASLTAGISFPRALISKELSTQHSRAVSKPGPQGANPSTQSTPEKPSQPRLFSLPHTLQHVSFPPQRGDR